MENDMLSMQFNSYKDQFIELIVRASGRKIGLKPPHFEINGENIECIFIDPIHISEGVQLANGCRVLSVEGKIKDRCDLSLMVELQIADDNPVVRFRYRLSTENVFYLTKSEGKDIAQYISADLHDFDHFKEVRFSEFDPLFHSYHPTELPVSERQFDDTADLFGPLFIARDSTHCLLFGYEHGSMVPDAYLVYHLHPQKTVTLQAFKGNYYSGQVIDSQHPFVTPWFLFACICNDEDQIANYFREFILRYQNIQTASRMPYIYYNTWNFQERNKWWHGNQFLDSMNLDRIMAEIDVAHEMGIDVFVIDTGWYEKTGDWTVSKSRFPDELKDIRAKLQNYGMKLGLWFGPTSAALSSHLLMEYQDCRTSRGGKVGDPYPVWETEASYHMCIVSRYADAFADELIRLNHELGVTYFKWDAIDQYGCDDPNHWHGTRANSALERAESYSFQMVQAMERIVNRVCESCPEAIVDFDITEAHRAVGLGFLAVGKYFLINNGPYYSSLDDPVATPGGGMGFNVFVFPGQARARLCRIGLEYDRWIPSVLFLTHYLPDDPLTSQMTNIASLVLGQNGIWGDLLQISDEGKQLFAQALARYKKISTAITESSPIRYGILGGSPEVYEKIHPQTGRGVVSIFAGETGQYTYITANIVNKAYWTPGDCSIVYDRKGRAIITVNINTPGGTFIFFGAS